MEKSKQTRLEQMDSHLQKAGLKTVEYSWYAILAGAMLSVTTFRYRKAPNYMVFFIGVGSGMALVECNSDLKKALGKESVNDKQTEKE